MLKNFIKPIKMLNQVGFTSTFEKMKLNQLLVNDRNFYHQYFSI